MQAPTPTPDPPTPVPPASETSPGLRYSRQILFAGIGQQGQAALAAAYVALAGVGATGAAAASMLARAGVGHLTLIDRDIVEPSNLQRQMLFDEADAADALPKAEAARARLMRLNSAVHVEAHIADLVPANIHDLLRGAHLVLDCTDNYETRYLLNDYAVEQGVPWIYAGAVGARAAGMNILPRATLPAAATPSRQPFARTACLACVFPQPPSGAVETCDTAGILSPAVEYAAALQVTEALKLLTGQPHRMRRTFVTEDLWSGERSRIDTGTPDPACPVCGPAGQLRYLAGVVRPHVTLCGRNSVQIHEHHRPLDLAALHRRLTPLLHTGELCSLRLSPLVLRFERTPHTVTVFSDGRALIQGTTDVAAARSLYARFIGA